MATAIYARQSINKKDSVSIETQIDICKREIKDNSEIKIYQDKGFSGKNTSRPAFKTLMDDVKQGIIKNIVVYRLDRISRSVCDFANIIDILKKSDVGFISANEKFDTSTPAGKAMLYIVMVFAQLERETIAERIKDNYYQRGSDGVWLGGPAPFGYDNIKISVDGKKVATIIENDDIDLVKYIFNEYVKDGTSLGSIARQIADSRGEMWNNIKLARMLHNPAYVKANADVYNYYLGRGCIIKSDISEFNGENGLNLYGKRDRALNKYNNIKDHNITVGLHHGIIPASQWLECQYKLSKNVQIKNSGKGKHTWLTGLVKCGRCGKALVVRFYKTTAYFNCSGRAIGQCKGEARTVYVKEVEDFVEKELKKYIENFSDCKIETYDVKNESEINEIKVSIAKVDAEIEKIVNNLAEANDILIKYANKRITELENKKTELINKLGKLTVQRNRPAVNVPNISNWDTVNNEFKKEVANIFINKILVYPDNEKIEILWKY